MYKIWKEFKFSASHILTGLPADHQCARLHGHNYLIEVELSSETLDETGFIVDFGELKPIKEWLDETFDHRHINDTVNYNPTAENMARHIFDKWRLRFPISAVRVRETDTSWAQYED